MRSRSDTWKSLTVRGRFTFETKAVINGVDYLTISAPKISRSLMNSPLQVGNCNSATLSISILTDDDLSTASMVVIKGRVTDGNGTYSEWLEFGTFYIDQRDTSYAGLITLTCYDAMLKTNQSYLGATDTELFWPKTMVTCVNEIAERIGSKFDPRTILKTGDAYKVTYPSGLTMQQVLGYIGACNGGNWIITEDNLLRLVPLVTVPDETNYIIDYDYERIKTAEGHLLVHKASDGSEEQTEADRAAVLNVPIVLGSLTNGSPITVTAVSGTNNDGTSYTAGDASKGVTLDIGSNPYVTQSIVDALYEAYNGLIYEPYTVNGSIYDPAAELGDQIIIGDLVRSVIYNVDMTLDLDFQSNMSAPNSEELTSEYPYLTEIQKLKQTTESFTQTVNQSTKELEQSVNENKDDLTALSEALTSEITRAGRVETELYETIDAEATRAKKAESDLDTRVTTLENINPESVTADISALKTTVANNTKSIETLQTTVDVQVTTLASIQSENENQSKAISDIQTVNTEQSEAITAVQNTLNSQGTTIKENAEALAQIKSTLANHGETLASIKTTVLQNAANIEVIKDQLTAQDTVLAGHTTQLTEIKMTLDNVLIIVKALQGDSGSDTGDTGTDTGFDTGETTE